MFIITSKIKVKPGKKNDYIEAAKDSVTETRKEQGNISYTLFSSTENDDELMFLEQWENEAAIQSHMKAPHVISFGKVAADMNSARPEFKVYTVQE